MNLIPLPPSPTLTTLALTLLLAAVALADTPPAPAQHASRPPNVVLILADDLGLGDLGCYGQKHIQTPRLDRLAADGMQFTRFYAAAPVCAPSRCSIMTGKHGGHAYVRDNKETQGKDPFLGQTPIPAAEVTLAELFKSKGYATGAFGKWGLGGVGTEGDPLRQGFDRFFGYNCQRHAHNYYPAYLVDDARRRELPGNSHQRSGQTYAPQVIGDEALAFVRANKDKPFFLYLPTPLPHLALQVPDADLEPYAGKWDEKPYEGKSYQHHPRPRAAYAAMISYLAAMISYLDRDVGRLLDLLDELKLREDTLVIFTSDNGPTHLPEQVDVRFFNSAAGLRGLKGSVYEGGLRVPMIASWPTRIAPGTATAHASAHYDLLATCAELLGVEPPAGSDGVSFLPTLRGRPEAQKQHEQLFWDFGGYGGQIAIRKGKWKAVRTGLRKNPDAPLELYDLEADPTESNNLAAQHPKVVAELAARILRERTPPTEPAFRYGRYAE